MVIQTSAGYSGTPLARKLGIVPGSCVLLFDAPDAYAQLLEPLPPNVRLVDTLEPAVNLVHMFALRAELLASRLEQLRGQLPVAVPVWVSWPKKASKVETDIVEDRVRAIALPMGWVDIKVCAVSSVWSGLKLVVRKELR